MLKEPLDVRIGVIIIINPRLGLLFERTTVTEERERTCRRIGISK